MLEIGYIHPYRSPGHREKGGGEENLSVAVFSQEF